MKPAFGSIESGGIEYDAGFASRGKERVADRWGMVIKDACALPILDS
jgi:hypothetical protein